jgi:hypothetical protein
MPLRGGTSGASPFKAACTKIRKTAERVYAGDPNKLNACKRVADEFERVVENEDHTPAYNPYQVFADRLKADFPEVWEGDERNSAKQALARWGVS